MKYINIKDIGMSDMMYDSILKLRKQYCFYFFSDENIFVKCFPLELNKNHNYTVLDRILKGHIIYIDDTHPDFNNCLTLEYKDVEKTDYHTIMIDSWNEMSNHIKYIQRTRD